MKIYQIFWIMLFATALTTSVVNAQTPTPPPTVTCPVGDPTGELTIAYLQRCGQCVADEGYDVTPIPWGTLGPSPTPNLTLTTTPTIFIPSTPTQIPGTLTLDHYEYYGTATAVQLACFQVDPYTVQCDGEINHVSGPYMDARTYFTNPISSPLYVWYEKSSHDGSNKPYLNMPLYPLTGSHNVLTQTGQYMYTQTGQTQLAFLMYGYTTVPNWWATVTYSTKGYYNPNITPTPTPTPDPNDCSQYEYINPEDTLLDFDGIEIHQGECVTLIPNFVIDLPAVGSAIPAIHWGIDGMSICPTWVDLGEFQVLGFVIPLDILALPAVIFLLTLIFYM